MAASESNLLGYGVLRAATAERSSASVVSAGVIAATSTVGTHTEVDDASPLALARAIALRQVYLPTMMR